MQLSPVRFGPLFQPYLWGGRKLAAWFPGAPAEGPVAEAWLVSDEAKFPSVVDLGPHAGKTLADLRREFGPRLDGDGFGRFPLLLKLLDAREHLSVQVHPNDDQAARLGCGQRGKTEAWVILHAEPGAKIFAGLRPGVDKATLRRLIAQRRLPEALHSFEPRAGDCIFLPAGTVHAIGAGLLLFEIQQTSNLTYRLHDWDRVDPRTSQPRPLHIEESLACIDDTSGPVAPVTPRRDGERELLVESDYFRLWRIERDRACTVGAPGECRLITCVEGQGALRYGNERLELRPGTTWLLPAAVGVVDCVPGELMTLLECGLPRDGERITP